MTYFFKLENKVKSHTFSINIVDIFDFTQNVSNGFINSFEENDRYWWALQLCCTANRNSIMTSIWKIKFKILLLNISYTYWLSLYIHIKFLRRGKLWTEWSIRKFLKLVEYYNKAFCNNLPWCKAQDLEGIFWLWEGVYYSNKYTSKNLTTYNYTVFHSTKLILEALL